MAQATHRHHKWATSNEVEVLIDIPTLIRHGSEDGIISPECREVLAKEVPNSTLVLILQASHLFILEKPLDMAGSIR